MGHGEGLSRQSWAAGRAPRGWWAESAELDSQREGPALNHQHDAPTRAVPCSTGHLGRISEALQNRCHTDKVIKITER